MDLGISKGKVALRGELGKEYPSSLCGGMAGVRCPPLRASFAQLPFGSLRIVSHNGRPFDVLRFHGRPKQLLCGNPAEVLEHVRSEAALACSPTTYTADSSLALSRHFPLTRASVCRDSRVQRHLARVYATLLVASALAAVGCYAHIAGVLSHGVLTQVHARIGPSHDLGVSSHAARASAC